tara:strand:- start:536 stop:1138 length:603 start_codon:yes stop_codon:yes gene_type:complete
MTMRIINSLFLLLFLAACATTSGPEMIAKKMEKEEKKEEEKVEKIVVDIPEWYLAPPDGKGVVGYFPGQGESKSVQAAIDIAKLEAQEDLANALNAKISSQVKKFISQAGIGSDATLVGEFESVTKGVVAETSVAGWSLKESEVQAQGTNYIAYVLLEYIYGSENVLLQQKIKQDQTMLTSVKATEAYAELEEEIKKAQQ